MLVSKICLTGGPCAGKSTALSKIERELTDLGYKVFIIDEVATRYINKGIRPFGEDCLNMYDFEDIILNAQLIEEKTLEKACLLINKPCIILCDRGVYDTKAYLSINEFDKLLKENNLSKLSLMDNYNLVIHMNTAAKGAEAFYTLENNKARSEGIKEAVIRDDKCQEAWSFHNNLKIVDNSTNFEEKICRVFDIVKEHLNIETKKEKKYLVEIDDIVLQKLDEKNVVKIDILQHYLETNSDYEIRLRKRSLDNDESYYITTKKNDNVKQKIITEEKIDKKIYNRLLNSKNIINTVEKQRICFIENNNLFKLDKFENGMFILEALDNVKLPKYIKVIKDVSLDDDYKNKNIKCEKIKNDLCKRRR